MEKINIDQLERLRISVNVYLLLVEDKLGRTVNSEEIELALKVEFGEFLSHFPYRFKFWRFGDMGQLNKKAALYELADCINFMNMLQGNNTYANTLLEGFNNDNSNLIKLNIFELDTFIFDKNTSYSFRMGYLINLGFKLGFTWDEIYEATLDKIGIINERLMNGY